MGWICIWAIFSLVPVWAFAQTTTPPAPEAIIQGILDQENSAQTLSDRLLISSNPFLGKPYLFEGPLGEGPQAYFDQDPLYRADGFDCTTFVETTLALALSRSLPEFQSTLNRIRYKDGVVGFTSRNHFVEIDWNPNNIAAGFFREVTQEVALPVDVLEAKRVISKKEWYQSLPASALQVQGLTEAEKQKRLNELHHAGDAFPDVESSIQFVKKSAFLTYQKHLPKNAVINVLRDIENPITHSLTRMVTHQVLLIQKNGLPVIRQASSKSTYKKVIEMSLEQYVQTQLDMPSVQGFNVLEILPQSF